MKLVILLQGVLGEKKKGKRYKDKCKGRRGEYKKRYKDKGKKACYIAQEETTDESKEHDEEVIYVAMRDDFDEDEATTLISYASKSDR